MFGNLWSGIKNVLGSVKSSLGASTISAFNTLSGQGAGSARGETPSQGGMSYAPAPTPDPFGRFRQNQTLVPTMSTTRGPAAVGPSGQTVVYNQGGSQNILGTVQANSGSLGVRPSTYVAPPTETGKPSWQAPVDAFGRVSTSTSGTPFFNAAGEYIVPQAGFTGMAGLGGGGTSQSTPATGMQGLSGTDLARGFGGVGGGTTATAYNQPPSDEEKRKQQEKGGAQSITPGPTQQVANALTASAASSSPKLTPSPLGDTVDVGWLQKTQEVLNSVAKSGLPEQDMQSVLTQIQTNLFNAKVRLDQATPTPQNPVEDTPEQLQFLETSQDPFGVKQAMDAFRAQNTNLAELQTTRVELMKNIQALNEAYRPIIKEIKENPNMPKALARRKIEALAVTQKETMQGLLDQLDIVRQQISDQNEVVNRQFQIVSLANTQANRAQDNLRANLQLMISSGAIAGMTDAELKQYAQAVGTSYSGLQKAKQFSLESKVDIVTNEFADGSLKGIDKKTGKVMWSLPGGAKTQTSSTDTSAQLYLPTVTAALAEGASPEEAVMAAVATAKALGQTMSNAAQQALLNEARRAKSFSEAAAIQDPISSFLFGGGITKPQTSNFSTPATRGKVNETATPTPSSTSPQFTIKNRVI